MPKRSAPNWDLTMLVPCWDALGKFDPHLLPAYAFMPTAPVSFPVTLQCCPCHTACMSFLATLLMLSAHFRSLPLFLASILFFFEAQLSWNLLQPFFRLGWVPHPCLSITTLAGFDCCAYNLAPMGLCFVCLFGSFFFLVCKRLREKSRIEILTPPLPQLYSYRA